MTVSVVLALAIHAHTTGECETARHHMAGLRRLVDMRGGLAAFRGFHGKILIEMLRYVGLDVSPLLDLTLSQMRYRSGTGQWSETFFLQRHYFGASDAIS